MHESDDEDRLFISWTLEAGITRVIDDVLCPARLTIRTDVNPMEDATEADVSALMVKIRFWFDHVVSESIAFSINNEDALSMFIDDQDRNRTSNALMVTPGDPSDDLLAALFQSKMTALANGKIGFSLVEVKSDNASGLSVIYVGDGGDRLPDIDEWVGERSYFDRPWWRRDDASTLDVVPPVDADLTRKPSWAFSLNVAPAKPAAPIVLRPDFRPTVILGGKTE